MSLATAPALDQAAATAASEDVRVALLAPTVGRSFRFEITAAEPGLIAGTARLARAAAEIGVALSALAPEGTRVEAGDRVCAAHGSAMQVARAEEQLLGAVAKTSGVATAAADFVARARPSARVVCGAWKKVPAELRPALRDAIRVGGAAARILDEPFVYLDKNHVRMLGGVVAAVRHAKRIPGRAIVVQIRGEGASVREEAIAAAAFGAAVLFVDTGDVADLAAVAAARRSGAIQEGVAIGFGGNVTRDNLAAAILAGAEVVDVGRAIIDGPLLDLRLDVR